MKSKLVLEFENLLERNQIPFMEISQLEQQNLQLEIKVYFPKIVKNLCKFFNDKYNLENKEDIVIRKDKDGYYQVDIFFIYQNKRIGIKLKSMLQNTWGIVNNL